METLIAEDLLLLLLDDESGRSTFAGSDRGMALAGALLSELALTELVRFRDTPPGWTRILSPGWNTAEVTRVHGAVSDDPLLSRALSAIDDNPRKPSELIVPMGRWTTDALLERLHQKGLIQPVEVKVLGVFPRTRWRAADRTREAEIRERIHAALVLGETPDHRTSALIALLSAIDQAQYCAAGGGLTHTDIQRRAAEIRAGDRVAETVKSLVEMSDDDRIPPP
ncbi:GOLPH3/VPS74 family protein [Nocardioides sp.]|uniref:GOLPH3/VPS74 family protein n=1 Tax=Nocardioides sp. TaxID=35761 RepID=UPI002C7BFB21|nr:GPP34 family phosphoprotein [Nocardioides sp.]HXH79875.1 GPP34 family phosphoprotein [Nocardioides sp.]